VIVAKSPLRSKPLNERYGLISPVVRLLFSKHTVSAIFPVVKRTTTELLIVVLALAFSCSCSAQQPSRPFKLPSGRVVRVLGTGRIDFPKGPPALMLKYETDLKISDMNALRKEADEIFSGLKVDAENGQFRSAIVSANEKPTGLILKNSKGYNFVYEKRADGQWHCLDDKSK
jgi:hypothetical protein